MGVRVQPEAFDPGAELSRFSKSIRGAGAIVSFTGVVRGDGAMTALDIEHYPSMTTRALTAIRDKAMTRWSLIDAMILHRHGQLTVGDDIMMVATAAPHRAAAFESADFLMDYLKSRAPFWKKEIGPSGDSWVTAKHSDEAALKRW